MRIGRFLLLCCGALAVGLRADDDVFDRIEQALTVSAAEGRVRARISGTADLEGYHFQAPTPELIRSDGETLFSPRLSVFLDAQLGRRVYFFAQARVDREFDPSDEGLQARLDEYALRIALAPRGALNFQVGKFATVIGNWTTRHNSWANPFINAPLPYEHLTGIWDAEAARTSDALLRWSHVSPGLPASITAREKYLRLPIVWGPSYAPGASLSGVVEKFNYAVELKSASLSSRPEVWARVDDTWSHPTISARIGYRPDQRWSFGFSASEGSYLRPFANPTLAPGQGRGDYREIVLAHDVAFAWHRLQLWAEIYGTRFAIPTIGNADTLAYYVEAKYKLTPRLFGALRWNQQLFGKIADHGVDRRWGRETTRLEMAGGFRFTPHLQFKLQASLEHGESQTRNYEPTVAGQFTVRF
jgi:hypothetical protein